MTNRAAHARALGVSDGPRWSVGIANSVHAGGAGDAEGSVSLGVRLASRENFLGTALAISAPSLIAPFLLSDAVMRAVLPAFPAGPA